MDPQGGARPWRLPLDPPMLHPTAHLPLDSLSSFHSFGLQNDIS